MHSWLQGHRQRACSPFQTVILNTMQDSGVACSPSRTVCKTTVLAEKESRHLTCTVMCQEDTFELPMPLGNMLCSGLSTMSNGICAPIAAQQKSLVPAAPSRPPLRAFFHMKLIMSV
eukprot:193664-Pelagomonas_calceolata.AAC.3